MASHEDASTQISNQLPPPGATPGPGALLALVAAEAPEPIAVFDGDYRFVVCNAAFGGTFRWQHGRAPEAGTAIDDALAHAPDELAATREAWRRALAGEVFTQQRTVHPTGEPARTFELTYRPLRSTEGATLGGSVVGRDITARLNAEEALRRREEELLQSQRIAGVGTWKWVTDEPVVRFSDQSNRMLGIDPTKPPLRIEDFGGLLDDTTYESMIDAWEKARHDGESFEVDLTAPRLRGRARFFSMRGEAVRDDDGHIIALRGTLQDITERHRAETALSASEDRWRFAVESAGDAIWDWNIADGHTYVSPRWREMLGYGPDDSVGVELEAWRSRMHPDDEPRVMRAMLEHLAGTRPDYEVEYRLRCKDGSMKWLLGRGRVTHRDSTGRPLRMIGTHTDISARKQAEEALRLSREEYRLVVEGQSELVCKWLPDTTLTFVNEAYCRHFGQRADRLVGRRFLDNVPAAERYAVERIVEGVVGNKAPANYENPAISAEGELRWLLWTDTPVLDEDGEVSEVLSVGIDITERKRAEEALRASEARFAAFMDNCPAAAWTTDRNGLMSYANATYARMFVVGDPTGRRREELFPAHLVEQYRQFDQRVLREDRTVEVIEDGLRADGSPGRFLVYKFPTQGQDGRTVVGGMALDITEREAAQRELRRNLDVLETLVETSSQLISATPESVLGVFQITLESLGRLLDVDRAWLFRVQGDELSVTNKVEWCAPGIEPFIDQMQDFSFAGLTWFLEQFARRETIAIARVGDLPAEAEREKAILEWQSIKACLIVPVVAPTGTVGFVGFDSVRRERQWMQAEVHAVEVLANTYAQVHERWSSEEARRISELRFRTLLDEVPGVAVQGFDGDGRLFYWNDASRAFYGYAPEQAMGMSLVDLVYRPEDLEEVRKAYRRMAETGIPLEAGPLELKRADGSPLWVFSSYAVVNMPGREPEIYCVDIDLGRLRKAEGRLRLFEACLEQLSDMVVIAEFMEPDQLHPVVVFVNKAFERRTGYLLDEVRGHNMQLLHGPMTDKAQYEILSEECRAGRTRVAELTLRTKAGEDYTVEVTKVPVLGDNGKVTHCIGVHRDVTERCRTERALRESELRWRFALEGAGDGVWDWDLVTNKVYYSLRWRAVLCIPEGKPVTTSLSEWTSRIHPDDLPRVQAACADYRAGRIDDYAQEYRALCDDGSTKWVLDRGKIVEHDSSGKPLRMIGTQTDITAFKELTRQLQESNDLLKALPEQIPGVLYQFMRRADGTYCFPFATTGIEAVYEVTPEQVRDDASIALTRIHPDDVDRIVASVEESARTLQPWGEEYRVLLPVRGLRWLRGDSRPTRLADGAILWHGYIQDITEIKRAEAEREQLQQQLQQAQKMESIGRLAGSVAHDFNNMLTVIMGHVALGLSALRPGDPLHADLLEVRDAAQRSSNLTRQLLAFARKQRIAPQVLDLNHSVECTLRMMRRLIGERIELTWEPGPELWRVKMDPSQIDQILANLLTNARDAMPATGVVRVATCNIEVNESAPSISVDAQPGSYVCLSVADNGQGMDADALLHLFEPFYTTKAAGDGTGLGLATVYGTVRQVGGFIHVQSQLGQGTTFTVYLPRTLEVPSPAASEPSARLSDGNETILVAEDEAAILELARRVLSRAGYRVLAANSPREAQDIADRHDGTIHLMITDVVMTGMSGSQLKAALQQLRPGLRTLYISGYTANEIAPDEAAAAGFHYLQKPFTVDQLLAKVRDVLDGPG